MDELLVLVGGGELASAEAGLRVVLERVRTMAEGAQPPSLWCSLMLEVEETARLLATRRGEAGLRLGYALGRVAGVAGAAGAAMGRPPGDAGGTFRAAPAAMERLAVEVLAAALRAKLRRSEVILVLAAVEGELRWWSLEPVAYSEGNHRATSRS